MPRRTRLTCECLETRDVPAAGVFGTAKLIAANLGPNTALVAVGRFNADAFLDVAVTNYGGTNSVTTLLGNGNGTFRQATRVTLATGATNRQPEGVTALDFDRDGDADLAVVLNAAGTNNVVILRNVGRATGTFQVAQRLTAGTNPTHIVAADTDNDGDQDLAASLFGGGVRIIRNNGGAFALNAVVPTGGGGSNQIAVADFDRDGDRDLAVANQDSDTVGILRNNGTGRFTLTDTLAAGDGTTFVSAGDVNGDGFADVTASNTFGSSVSIFLNIAGGAFEDTADIEVGANPTGVVVRDFTGDGLTDIAVGTAASGDVIVLRNDGEGGFLEESRYAAAAGVTGVTSADFNNDGRPDLVTTQYDGGNGIAVLTNRLIRTTTTLIGFAPSIPFGEAATFRATVTAATGPAPTTGFVSFLDGSTFLGVVAVTNGVAEFTTDALPSGAHTIRAVYSDAVDLTWFGSSSAGLPFVVLPEVAV